MTTAQQQVRINVEPPGTLAKPIIERDTKYLATSTKCLPIVVAYAHGPWLVDVDGNSYLDFTCGVGVTNVGHCHPKVVTAIKTQVEKLMHFAGTDFYYEIQVELAEKLNAITPGEFHKKVFYTNSGTEAIEAGIKLAKMSTARKQFLGFLYGFHGRTAGSASLTASRAVQRNQFFPLMPGVVHVPYAHCYRCVYHETYPSCDLWCVRIIEEVYFDTILPPDELAAIVVEPVQGEGGFNVPPPEFIRELSKLASKYKILLIDDEVQAGFGRTGKMFAIEHYNVVPDIIAIAKGMGSGLPIGATVFRSELDFKVKGAHSNTYGGNPVACASALATIEVIENENLIANASKLGVYLRKRLDELQETYELIGDVRGLGLMQATEFVTDRKTKSYAVKQRDKILELAFKNGLVLLPTGKSAIRYLPPLIISEAEIDTAIEILANSIKNVSS